MEHLMTRKPLAMRVRALGVLPLSMRRRVMHRLLIGEWPNLKEPKFYSEVSTRELLREEGLLASIAGDKAASKFYARGACPDLRIAETRWLGTDPATIPDSALDGQWVVKLNAGSGACARGEGVEDREDLEGFIKAWQGDSAAKLFGTRYYARARQGFIIEDYIEKLGERPTEVRYFCFGGRAEFGAIISFAGGVRQDWYVDRNGVSIEDPSLDVARTVLPDGMLEVGRRMAERLSVGFNHVRVDLPFLGNEIWFGELTPYPASGLHRFSPRSFDLQAAASWRAAVGE